ncbi:endoribonuclease l-psp like protein [Zymoseptoria brevis]|uniref:Endoribonuclease l-psp like protein n=1 Tax=Zymoseptoria brevis TaxID=1047168 RepID=A0A0F4GBK2_9PEZI|nr:endoribonuclease l-psp like protein [Zymoseptoria brevis]
MSRQSTTINPSSVPEPQPQFSQVNTFTFQPGDNVAITGQLAIQPNPSDPVPTGFEDQVRLALQNLENCLKAAGATKRDIFKVTHHVVDFDYEKQNPAKAFIDWLGSDFRPASAMLPVQRLAGPGLMYEIETWAIVPAK